jgi:TIR domain
MQQLLDILSKIQAGQLSFKPADASDESFNQFQPIASRLKAILDRGLVHDIKFLKSHTRSTRGFAAALVTGGLTFEGEEFLKQSLDATGPSPILNGSHMKFFISHSSVDADVAEQFVDLLRSALDVQPDDIRCTSVPGYKLTAGSDTNEQLRQEVFESVAFVALLSPSSLQSTYVLFELGARWGAKKFLAPVLIAGAGPAQLRSPLSAIHAVSGSSESDVLQLLDSLATVTQGKMQKPHTFARALAAFRAAATVVKP